MVSLDEALAGARQRYVDQHPVSRRIAERASVVLPGGNTRSVLHIDPFAFRVAGASGARIDDVDGHTYVDLLGNYSSGLLGRRKELAEAITGVLERGWSIGAMVEAEATFAERIVERFASIDQVRFTNSGSEANLLALMTARHTTGRARVVAFDGAYHGGPLSFGAGGEPLRVPFDYVVLPYNDVPAVERAFAEGAATIAAVLVEPMLGSGGCIPGTPGFLGALRRLTAESGAVLIFDEVMTSRFAVGGMQSLLGITPDMTTLGKYFGGGLSFGAFGGRRSLMAAYDPAGGGLAHGGTFNNNAFTMATGVVAVDLLDAALLDEVNQRGERLRTALSERFAASPLAFCATGHGSLLNIHPCDGPVESAADLAGADPRWRALLFHELLHAGYYLAPRGYIALTAEVGDDDVDGFADAVGELLDRYASLA